MKPSSKVSALVAGFLVAGSVIIGSDRVGAASTPGTRPATNKTLAAAAQVAATTNGGLQPVVNERGHISKSIAAATDATAGATIRKPQNATVRKAYFAVASTGFSGVLTQPLSVNGASIPLEHEVSSGIGSANYFMDVTSVVKPLIDSSAPGPVLVPVVESEPARTDGTILVVIFDDPAVIVDQTVSILYGALAPSGDHYTVNLERPVSRTDAATRLEMSLGISFSFQSSAQYSTVDVNGSRLTSSAGGQDDGYDANGGLITVGGEGDSPSNPTDPMALPSGPRSDDELYDLLPFVRDGDNSITVSTTNPSSDDNIFLATFTMNPPVTSINTGSGTQWVAMGDSFSSGEGADWFYDGTDTDLNGCRRSDAYASIANKSYLDNLVPDSKFSFVACSGARINHFMKDAQYPKSPNGVAGGKPQLDYLREIGADAGIVTMTMGGNDMGFSNVLAACTGAAAKDSGSGATYDIPWLTDFNKTAHLSDWRALAATCDRYANKNLGSFAVGVETNINAKEDELVRLYAAAAAAAPNAKIYVMGYPVFIPGENTATPSCGGLFTLSGQERTWLRTLIQQANDVVKRAVSRSDDRVVFVDDEQVVEDIGSSDHANHLICAKVPYWHGESVHGDLPGHNRFHPKREAHVEMAKRLASCIKDSSTCNPPKPWKQCDGRAANIYGTLGDDELRGLDTAHQDVIVTLGGNDKVNALNGNDVVCGGTGNDSLYGMGDNDRLFGQSGDDLLDGGDQSDFCDGGDGSDRHADCETRTNFP